MLADLYFTSLNTCSHAVALHWGAMKSSLQHWWVSPEHICFFQGYESPHLHGYAVHSITPHLPPWPWWGIRRWMDGWIFNFLFPSLHPLTFRTDTYVHWELLCTLGCRWHKKQLLKVKLQLRSDSHFQVFPLVFCHTRAAYTIQPKL